jgi:hypothetical protein
MEQMKSCIMHRARQKSVFQQQARPRSRSPRTRPQQVQMLGMTFGHATDLVISSPFLPAQAL